MSDFTASNGIAIEVIGTEGDFTLWNVGGDEIISLTDDELTALREFLMEEEDKRLGRWRVPGYPNWVCYAATRTDEVVVFNEEYPQYGSRVLSRGDDTWPYYRPAANAFFEAHPEADPRPWLEAKPGEVWLLTFSDAGGGATRPYTVRTLSGMFENPDILNPVSITDSTIAAGRRIWPEVAS